MSQNITKLLSCNFQNLVKGIKIMETHHPYLYHPILSKSPNYQQTDTYQGGLLCGEACFLTKFILDINGFTSEVWKNHQGYGKYYSDHCFIWLPEEELIVDLTYKQFFQDDRVTDTSCPYHHYIYQTLPPFFVGQKRDITRLIEEASQLNQKYYGSSSLHNIWKYWRFNQNITQKFDLSRCLQDKTYFKEKPGYYQKAAEIFNLEPGNLRDY